MRKSPLKLRQHGFSLVEAMVGVGLFSLFAITAAYVGVQNQIIATGQDIQSQIDQVHQYTTGNVQQFRGYAPKISGTTTTTSGMGPTTTTYAPPTGPALETLVTSKDLYIYIANDHVGGEAINCLSGRGTPSSCNGLNAQTIGSGTTMGMSGLSGTSICSGAKCNITSSLTMTVYCKNGTCQYLDVQVVTPSSLVQQIIGSGTRNYKQRRSSIRIPASVFNQKSEPVVAVNFACTASAGRVLTQIDFTTQTASCANAAQITCGTNSGIFSTSACRPGANLNCASAITPINDLGLLNTQPVCGAPQAFPTIAAGGPPPPPVIPATTTSGPTTTTTLSYCTITITSEYSAGCSPTGVGFINSGTYTSLSAWTSAATTACTANGSLGSFCSSASPANILRDATCDCSGTPPATGPSPTTTTTIPEPPVGGCLVGHPIGWSNPVPFRWCAEYFLAVGGAFTYETMTNGQIINLKAGYVWPGGGWGYASYQCVNGALVLLPGSSCNAGIEP